MAETGADVLIDTIEQFVGLVRIDFVIDRLLQRVQGPTGHLRVRRALLA
jgi:hypothetical protein